MSPYNCCISHKPPSPESLPSRPVKLSTDAMPVASWSTASRLSKLEDVAELRALFDGDRLNVDDDESKAITVKRSSSTLDAVKSKLRKHLSRESALSKHRPRSTVGNSDEEIQRRKELRLIRDRRIKEELSSEGSYDDDAKSLSTVATENSPYRKTWPNIRSEDTDTSKLLEAAPPQFEAMRKSADAVHFHTPSPISAIQRRHSLAVLNSPQALMKTVRNQAFRGSTLDLPMPPSPTLKPQRLPSIVGLGTRQTSWRLSFASDQRATQLRALSHEYELSSSNAGSGAHSDLAGPLKWFRGQITRPQPGLFSNLPEHCSVPDGLSRSLDDYQGVDGNAEVLTAPVSLLDMRISQRLASRGLHSHSSSPQLSSWSSHSHYRGHSYNSDAIHLKSKGQSKHHQSASNSGMSEFKLSTRWGDVLRDSITSIYASTDKNGKPVSEGSGFSIPSLNALDREQASFPSVSSQDNPRIFQALPFVTSIVDVIEDNTLIDSVSASSVRQDRRYTMGSSILASETLSFREREVELAMIKTRFPKAMEKPLRTFSIRSKFNEEFGEQQMPIANSHGEKPSLSTLLHVPRLAKLVSKSYDGASPFELQVPGRQGFGYTFSNRNHSTASTVSPGARSPGSKIPSSPSRDPLQPQGDDGEGIWVQALKRTQEEYESQLASELSPTNKDLSARNGSFSAIRSVSWKLKGKGRASVDSSKDVKTEILPIGGRSSELERGLRRQARKVESERAKADEWADELEARERQAKAKTAAVGLKLSPPRARIPPESWARFPSHTREERTASAGLLDYVNSKDFAIKDIKDGVIEWMTSNRKHYHHHHEKEKHHSLPIRVRRQIRASLYKLRTTKSTATSDAIHGRKSSVSVGGKLEFPELEILAGEIAGEGLFEEVERETEEGMRRNERAARMVVFGEDGIDGEGDVEGNMTVLEEGDVSEISIADPRFYDDCVTLPLEEDDDNNDEEEIEKIISEPNLTAVSVGKVDLFKLDNAMIKKEKYRTWSGKDRVGKALMDNMALRRSTLDFQIELEMMESLERDRAVRSAEEAWGG